MGTLYRHLRSSDRTFIEVLLRWGANQSAVAGLLGFHRCTISREVRRAQSFGLTAYVADFGQRFYAACRRRAGLARRKLGPDMSCPAWLHVLQGLAAHRSPQEIAGRLARSFFIPRSHLRHPAYVSHETIYCAIYAMPRGTLRRELVSQLARSPEGRRPRSRAARSPKLPGMTSIALRPPEVAARIVPGHWEGDLIKGARGLSAVGTLVERVSRYVILVPLAGLGAQAFLDGFSRRLRDIPPLPAQDSDLRPGLGDGLAQNPGQEASNGGLLLRCSQPLAARLQRERQRHHSRVPAQGDGSVTTHRQEPSRSRVRHQQCASQDP